MSYKIQADMADDGHLSRRVIACAATENVDSPEQWAYINRWPLYSQPGWVDAYAAAVEAGVEHPGEDENAITDGMILDAVQAINTPETPSTSGVSSFPRQATRSAVSYFHSKEQR